MATRVIVLGTPSFAVPTLNALLTAPTVEVVAAVTQPDRPQGRGRQLVASPVKQVAIAHGLPVLQPERLRGLAVLAQLQELQPDLLVIAAYGQILRQAVLDIPRFGCLNVHPSLLPHHRGPAPIAAAILNGDQETGVTIMLTDRGMDSGPILTQRREPLARTATTASLTAHLAEVGAHLLLETIPGWLAGTITPQPQDEAQATITRTFTKADGAINWADPALAIERQVRAFNPWPGTYTFDQGRRLILLDVQAEDRATDAPPGTVVAHGPGGPFIATGAGLLLIREVQPEGRRPISGVAFLNGASAEIGRQWGNYGSR